MSYVVIIGGSYVGTKVTLIDPSNVFYYNITSLRIIAKLKEARDYTKSINTSTKVVRVKSRKEILYDYLVVALGLTTLGTITTNSIIIISVGLVLLNLKALATRSAYISLKNLDIKIVYSTRVNKITYKNGKSITYLNDSRTLEVALVISIIRVDENIRILSIADNSVYALSDNIITKVGSLITYDASNKLMIFVPIRSKTGTRQISKFMPFSFIVAIVKGKDYFISKATTIITT
ncbi:hypothetical protein M438DRAFT_378867 [Aureobasidium pullulans EXF-150]|uniref:Uncharacterized protein n=1 Tax=Aureobasidium pullulans EXF-150 TaxID=1043002 RepID=A0A074WZ65_AURPU|nr:uncharacterized protein M438DRAFT_378867 [Aureobasidium pullulans EXF-150]KEQ78493.1 hypothetical protein M438DRAFT_378867 [Aureobasidium pullulans EXF-150]